MRLIFEWDLRKARANLKKHGVSFDEAKSVFEDQRLLTFADDFHPHLEDRYISIGLSSEMRILLLVHTETQSDGDETIIRLISVRKATKSERLKYEER